MNPEQPHTPSVLEKPHIREVLSDRSISPEHYHLIEALGRTYSRSEIIEGMHNFFNGSRENSRTELERLVAMTDENDKWKKMYDLCLELSKHYDYTACYAIIRALEKP
jgi:hypothetical protein